MPISDLLATHATPNIVIFITDQERDLSEWPQRYQATLAATLSARQQLMDNGLTFTNAYTGACMCSPSRATFLTSQYPIVTGCTAVGGPALPTPDQFPNLATVLQAAGYTCYWIGKWHLLADEPGASAEDLEPWGFEAYTASGASLSWDPPDAGITLDASYLGGGTQGPGGGSPDSNQNDQRYVADALAFLASPPSEPWCLVVSLVNPHDSHLGYLGIDGTYYDQSAYADEGVPMPTDVDQSLETMPRGQAYYRWDARAKVTGAEAQQNFINFYAYLMQYVDGQIDSILRAMQPILDQTLIIRYADHGEMGLSHGLIEKFVSAYGEATHVPFIISNPIAYPEGQTSAAMASTVDLVPTLASLFGVSEQFCGAFVGADLSPVLDDPGASVQDYVHYTYDDLSGTGPSVIRTVRSSDWVYSVYMDSVTDPNSGYSDADWELYSLAEDPGEDKNLAGQQAYAVQQTILDQELQAQMQAKGTAPAWFASHWPPTATAHSRGGPPQTPPEPPQ